MGIPQLSVPDPDVLRVRMCFGCGCASDPDVLRTRMRFGCGCAEVRVTVRYFAGAAAAAGTTTQVVELALSTSAPAVREPADRPPAHTADRPPTVGDVLDVVRTQHGAALARVLDAASLLLDATSTTRTAAVRDGAVLDVLPPFAGG